MKAEHIENEIKIALGSLENYRKLIEFLEPMDNEYHQQNIFFDSEDRRLRAAGWALRVRVEESRGLVTLKSIASRKGPVTTRKEIEAEVPRNVAEKLCEWPQELLSLSIEPIDILKRDFGDIQLVPVSRFENLRRTRHMQIGNREYLLEIDRTDFSDGSTDYELEVELDDSSEADKVAGHLLRLFDSLMIPYEYQPDSKLARALYRTAEI